MIRRSAPWVGLFLSALLAAGMVATTFLAWGSRRDANAALEGARRLYEARVDVAKAEETLGGSDIEDAVASAHEANAAAENVSGVIARIVRYLRDTEKAAAESTRSAARGAGNVAFTRRQVKIASGLLGAVAGYQRAASRYARHTNVALARILRALEKTNESFPPNLPGALGT